MAYIIPDDLSEYYPSDITTEELLDVCDLISEIIDEHCYTSFTPITKSEKLDSKATVVPTMGPLLSVTSLKDDTVTIIEDTDFFLYPDYINVVDPSGKRKAIQITYKYGYEKTPRMVSLVAKELALYYLEKPGISPLFKTLKADDYAYEIDDDGVLGILDQLDSFKRERPSSTSASGDSLKGRKIIRVGVI